MYPQTHIIFGLLFAVLLALTGNYSPLAPFIIFASSVLIDVDHWFIYVKRTGKLGIKPSYDWFIARRNDLLKQKKRNPKFVVPKVLCIFHTIEFYLILSILAFYSQIFYWILIGISFHYLLDFISDVREKDHGKALSMIYYLIKNKP